MIRYCAGTFSEARRATIGADYMTKKMNILDTDIILQIWDTAGQERFHQGTLGSAFYRGADGALLVYDISNEKSFEQVSHWRDEAISRLDPDTYFPIVVVGNKVDLRGKDCNFDQSAVRTWCSDNGYGHIETSAKDNTGVQAAMEAIAAQALDAKHRNGRNVKSSNRNDGSNPQTITIDRLYSPGGNPCAGAC